MKELESVEDQVKVQDGVEKDWCQSLNCSYAGTKVQEQAIHWPRSLK